MKKLFSNYKQSVILIGALIVGVILGLIFKEDIIFLKPFGDLFLNLLLIIIVPLIFLTITTSIGKMKEPKRIGKVLYTILITFIITSLVSVLIGVMTTSSYKLVDPKDSQKIKANFDYSSPAYDSETNYLDKTVNTISTNDFQNLLSRNNLIALITFSILFGIAINISKEKGKPLLEILDSANNVLQKFIKIIMYYAPIGLGCYMATLIGTYGEEIAIGYMRTFIVYTIICTLVYFVLYSFYAYFAGNRTGFKKYWQNILPPTMTALATCSSAATIPINTKAAENIGVSEDVANTTIPLGTSFHKDGSIIGSVFKIMFLICLFNQSISLPKIIGIALVATILVTAVPIGGGTISEMLIISMLGLPIAALPILTIIATIIDAPATVLNAVGNTASSMVVSRFVDGKNWLNK